MKMAVSFSLHALFVTFFLTALGLASCPDISSVLPGKVFARNSPAYNASVSSYFFLGQRLSPIYIVAPTTAEEVAEIVKAVSPCANCQLAVRSGGHSPNAGFSNTDHGFTIDLRGLDDIALQSPDSDVLSVGTGSLWIDVYKFIEPLNRTVVGSRVASVGAGGFISGGWSAYDEDPCYMGTFCSLLQAEYHSSPQSTDFPATMF
jgi:hypothetical protein